MAEESPVVHAWDRWLRVWHALFFACLTLSLALALPDRAVAGHRPLLIALSLAFAGWYLWWVVLHPLWMDRPGLMTWYVAGMFASVGVLIALSPSYFTMLYALYPQVFMLIPTPWTYGVAVALSGVMFGVGSLRYGTDLSDFGVSTALAVLLGLFVNAIARQSRERHEAITELTATNERLAAALAENDRLQGQILAQARASGALAERQRLARDIHDTIAQGLIAIVTQLEAAERESGSEQGRRLSVARRLARDGLDEARRSVDALRPAPLDGPVPQDQARLPIALVEVAAGWSAAASVRSHVTTTGTATPLHPEIEVTLLRITQEALANIAKHAGAGNAWVTLSYMDGVVNLDVRDDGGGFDPARAPTGGYGLTAMRERAVLLGGTFDVESGRGDGTVISASIPLALREGSR